MSNLTFAKYVINSKDGIVDNKKVLDPEDDAVTSLLGSEYRMPTVDEFKELYKHCTGTSSSIFYKYTDYLSGVTFVSKNGIYWVKSNTLVDNIKYTNAGCLFVGQDITNRVFFPASGNCNDSSIKDVGSEGYYWSSSLSSCYSSRINCLYFNNSDVDPASDDRRYWGLTIRGVKVV